MHKKVKEYTVVSYKVGKSGNKTKELIKVKFPKLSRAREWAKQMVQGGVFKELLTAGGTPIPYTK